MSVNGKKDAECTLLEIIICFSGKSKKTGHGTNAAGTGLSPARQPQVQCWVIKDVAKYNNFAVRLDRYLHSSADVQTCPTRGGSLFGCNTLDAYRSFRNAYPGESGERNVFRLPGFWTLDMGLGKTFDLPWEDHKFQFRWEVFNVTNTQKMGTVTGYTIRPNPQNAAQVPTNFASFIAIQGSPRSMQFVLRYSF